ncbi:MAG: hypothetical protein DMG57_18625 [Acidobacteria bacterium]|nr:MAG: hypothetical protein DMG57_18625 [Acidobacteriota bacterium]
MKDSSLLLVLGSLLAAALFLPGSDWHQEWKLKPSDSVNSLHFTVKRSKWGNNWSTSNDVPLSSFHGLSPDLLAHGGRAKFEYVHDAGRLICEGSFFWGRGSGSFTFAPNAQFVSELERLGYEAPNDDQLFSMLMTDVSLEFARGVRDVVPYASTKQLIELRIHGVTLAYIREARQAGYKDLTAQDYVEMRIHGVETDFLRDLKSFGYNLQARDIVELRIHGVSSEFVGGLKQAGYDLSAKQITELRIHGVDSEYLRELKSYGLQPGATDLVQLRIHGVSPDYLKGLKDAGYGQLPANEITELRIHGVQTDFIQEAKNLGYNFTPRELVELGIHGVDGSYLKKLNDTGMKNLTASQIAKLRIHGVE